MLKASNKASRTFGTSKGYDLVSASKANRGRNTKDKTSEWCKSLELLKLMGNHSSHVRPSNATTYFSLQDFSRMNNHIPAASERCKHRLWLCKKKSTGDSIAVEAPVVRDFKIFSFKRERINGRCVFDIMGILEENDLAVVITCYYPKAPPTPP